MSRIPPGKLLFHAGDATEPEGDEFPEAVT